MTAALRRGLVLVPLLLAAALGCAKKGPPSGGPPDLERPRITETSPDSGAAGVARDGPITVTFSEGMEPRVTGESVELAPRVEIRQRRWSGRTMTLVLAETLGTNRTYTLFVSGTARDRHGNPMTVGHTIPFTTADTFPAGRIEGKVVGRGFGVAGTYLWCYDASRTTEPDSTARDFDAVGLADDQGAFAIPGLDAPGRYRLWVFADLNQNRSFEPDRDILADADTLIELTAEHPVTSGLLLRVTNPRATARVAGAVLDTLGDSLGILRVIAHSERDTLRRLLVDVGSQNGFEFQLESGPWSLQAWRDLDRDKLWDLDEEPASEVELVELGPADEVKGVVLVLLRPPRSTLVAVTVPFIKMHGAGNDFVVVDHRVPFLPEPSGPLLARLCDRRRGVGADGVLLLERDPEHDFAMRYFNADGGPAEFCGNGARCIARLALELGLGRGGEVRFRTAAGVQSARRSAGGRGVELHFGFVGPGEPRTVEAAGRRFEGRLIRPGVPHFVVPVERVEWVPVAEWGAALRHHPDFGPAGANVDFVATLHAGHVAMRTYERGVEAETLACGSGAIATATHAILGGAGPVVRVLTAGGDELEVSARAQGEGWDVTLSGPAEIAFRGEWMEPAPAMAGKA